MMYPEIHQFFEKYSSIKSPKESKKVIIHRIEVAIHNHHPCSWLSAHAIYPKFYLANRDHSEELATLGTIYETKSLSNMQSMMKHDSDIIFCGGMAFDPQQKPQNHWKKFGKKHFFIPRFAMKTAQGITTILIFLKDTEITAPFKKELLAQVQQLLAHPAPELIITPSSKSKGIHFPNKKQWVKSVLQAKKDISQNKYKKIVLARETLFKQSLHPEQLLSLFSTPANTIDYYYQISKTDAFVGRSPEYIFRRHKRNLVCEAVAASILASQSTDSPIISDPKSKKEHEYVTRHLTKQINTLSVKTVKFTDTTTIVHLKLIHLFSTIRSKLKRSIQDCEIIHGLHPTPAVGGFPRKDIIKILHKKEPFSRGWYAGLIGTLSKDKTDMAVAIRGMLINKNTVRIFSGAGIISESDANLEWDELEQKTQYFKDILNGQATLHA